jgi:hypothetical protein
MPEDGGNTLILVYFHRTTRCYIPEDRTLVLLNFTAYTVKPVRLHMGPYVFDNVHGLSFSVLPVCAVQSVSVLFEHLLSSPKLVPTEL